MKIAVGSQNLQTVTPHGGKTRRFIIFEAGAGTVPEMMGRLELPPALTLHNFRSDGPHPLDAVDVVIVASAGEGFVRRLAERGVKTVITDEKNPLDAVLGYLRGELRRLPPHEVHHRH